MWQIWLCLFTFDVCKYPTRDKLLLIYFYFLFCQVTLSVWASLEYHESAVFFFLWTQWNQFISLCQANSITRVFKKNCFCFVWCLVQLCTSIQYVQNDIWERMVSCLTVLTGCYTQTEDLPFNYYVDSNHSIW